MPLIAEPTTAQPPGQTGAASPVARPQSGAQSASPQSLPPSTAAPGSTVVSATARLHLGFLDPGASLGRRFGSLGLSIDGLSTTVELLPASEDRVVASNDAAHPECARVSRLLADLKRAANLRQASEIRLHTTLPAHAGFGSGTQLALAVGRAFANQYQLPWTTADIARILGRGGRSGVGIAAFDQGGLLVDGGPQSPGHVPPLLARFDFPEAWRIVLVQDVTRTGLHGDAEKTAIRALPPFPQELAAQMCHRILMQILPATAEADFAPFAEGVNLLQTTIGDYFASAQGGDMYASPAVGRLLHWAGQHALAATGQSSWGPTGFAILPSQSEAERLLQAARHAGLVDPALRVQIVRGRNRGAQISRPAAARTA
ncbi:beta-ribofuranosylaminobenzene 5'-phosphate synthase family protein [Imbroritus primus]|uniref:beta-ribofuranosylaminobenzene 5'-phosphate synthase family protein n=1 Tax=Imbroritus primus TaxID=3058603 RepID=UPI003D1618FD